MDFKAMLAPVSFSGKSKADEVPAPVKTSSKNRRLAALREAGDILRHLPGPGECLHALMTGRYDLTDLVDVLIERLGTVDHFRVATLSFNRHNVKLLQSWADAGKVKELTLLFSLFFQDHNPDVVAEMREAIPRAHLAASRNHCKVCCLSFSDGRKLALEGSANLRTNGNREQFMLINDPALHDWHAAWIDGEVKKHGVATNEPFWSEKV